MIDIEPVQFQNQQTYRCPLLSWVIVLPSSMEDVTVELVDTLISLEYIVTLSLEIFSRDLGTSGLKNCAEPELQSLSVQCVGKILIL